MKVPGKNLSLHALPEQEELREKSRKQLSQPHQTKPMKSEGNEF